MHLVEGLVAAFASAVAINWSYMRQHRAVDAMPKLSLRRPRQLLVRLLSSRAWLLSFGAESVGWLLYLAGLRLAPIALVQGVGASGIAVLALVSTRGRPRTLPGREQVAVLVGIVGLAVLSVSIASGAQADRHPPAVSVAIWLAAVVGGAALVAGLRTRMAPAAALGLASGLLFAAGDICSKLVVFGHVWLTAAVPLLAAYAAGTGLLQVAFQHGRALTAAGLATLATNAAPIVSGFVLFDEELPSGIAGGLQAAGFAALVGSAILLAGVRVPQGAGAPAAGG